MTNMLPDGSPVDYIGPTREGVVIGDHGKLLTSAGRAAHVMWRTGAQAGHVTLVDVNDLVQPRNARVYAAATSPTGDGLDDSLDVGLPTGLGLGHLCALRGPGAVLTAIAATQPPDLRDVRERVRVFAEEQVAATPTIQRAASQLDDEETAELVRLATEALLRETFGVDGG